MSIADQLVSLEINRNTIRAKLVELGMATSTDRLDTLSDAIANLVNRGAVSVTVKEGDTYTIPAGYHNGSGTVSGVSGGGNYNLQSKTATPTKKQQNVTPDDGYFGLSDVTVAPIPDAYQDVTSVTATAGDVLVGKIYVNAAGNVVAGTIPNNGAVSKTLDTTTKAYTVPKGYHNGTGKVSITTESKSATPTKAQQKITPSTGKVLSDVTIAPIPDAYQNVSGVTAGAADVLSGKKIVSKTGAVIDGAIPVNGDVSATIDGLNTTSCTIPAGHTTGGTVSLTNDIENALDAIVGGENSGIKNELASLAESKAAIAAAIKNKGVTVPTGTKLDGMAALIGQIKTGSSLQSKNATPTKKQQSITPDDGYFGLSDVTIAPIPDAYHDVSGVDATAEDVLAGKKIETESGTVTGTMPDNGTINKTLDTSTVSYTIPKGNHSGTGKVSITPETKTVTPTKSTQNITPTAGKVLSKVTVDAIPDSYVQPTKTGSVTANGTYNVREYKSLSVNVASSGSSLPTSTISGFGSAGGGTWYYIDANGQGKQYKATDWPTVKAIKGSYIIADFGFGASGYYLDGFELVHAYGPVLTTAGEDFYVVILKITGDNPTAMM